MERFVAGVRWVDSGFVFTSTIGTPLEAARVTRAFHVALDRSGLPGGRFHDMRHAAATFMLSQGATLEDVKIELGHAARVPSAAAE
jgi:integrase